MFGWNDSGWYDRKKKMYRAFVTFRGTVALKTSECASKMRSLMQRRKIMSYV